MPILNFYFVLDMPNVRTISDALSIWSNRFKTSEQKAVIQLLGLLFKTRLYDSSSYRDKNKALRAISQIVIRYYAKLKRGFHNIGERGTRCERAKIFIKRKRGVSDKIIFQGFLDKFLDLKECRYKCGIERFLCGRYKSEVEKYIEYASNLANPLRRENKGFIEISKKLNRILQKEIINSCKLCEAIGDAVIALETPENMILEHTDHSFNLLCELIEKPHYQHPSEISVVKN